MQYIIETTNYGCMEYLKVNGRTFTKRTEKTEIGSKSLDDDFADQLEKAGYDEEIVNKVYDLVDDAGIYALEFMETAQLF